MREGFCLKVLGIPPEVHEIRMRDVMYNIDDINIGDLNYDRVCLNCRYWVVDVQLRGAANGVICTRGNGHTNPNDTCPLFSPNMTVDGFQDQNRYFDKREKMQVWKSK